MKRECLICGHTLSVQPVNQLEAENAAEGLTEAIQEHVFQHHCARDENRRVLTDDNGNFVLDEESQNMGFESTYHAWS